MLFSEPKIPQLFRVLAVGCERERFSALQRAENSSIEVENYEFREYYRFQCSSASRKFLNPFLIAEKNTKPRVSVLFSEPKIPQF